MKLSIGCWNVRTLLDPERSGRLERRTALVTNELQRLNIDIVAFSETHLSGEDQVTEVGSGYTLGVGFRIRSTLVDKIEHPTGITDRLMKLRVPLACGQCLVCGKFKLCIRRKIRTAGVRVPKRIDVSKLKDPAIRMALNEKLSTIEFDDSWETFKDQVYTSGVEILGLKKSVHRDWFNDNDQEIKALLEAKKVLHKTLLNDNLKNGTIVETNYKEHKEVLQRELRRMKNVWWSNISAEVQSAYNRKDTKDLYSLLKQVFGPKPAPFLL